MKVVVLCVMNNFRMVSGRIIVMCGLGLMKLWLISGFISLLK